MDTMQSAHSSSPNLAPEGASIQFSEGDTTPISEGYLDFDSEPEGDDVRSPRKPHHPKETQRPARRHHPLPILTKCHAGDLRDNPSLQREPTSLEIPQFGISSGYPQ